MEPDFGCSKDLFDTVEEISWRCDECALLEKHAIRIGEASNWDYSPPKNKTKQTKKKKKQQPKENTKQKQPIKETLLT